MNRLQFTLPTFTAAFLLALAPPATLADDRIARAIAQSFRTCNDVLEVDQSGSQFRILSHHIWRKEFDLLDLELDSVQGDRVYLTCSAPGCVSAFYSSGGRWNKSQPENAVSLNCVGAGSKISRQLRYFFDASDSAEAAPGPERADWRPIGRLTTKFGETEVELNYQSVQKGASPDSSAPIYGRDKNELISAWIRMSFPPYRSDGRSMSSATIHVISDCYMKNVKVDGMIAFSGRKGSGTELASSSDDDSAQWASPVSSTPQGLAYRILCK